MKFIGKTPAAILKRQFSSVSLEAKKKRSLATIQTSKNSEMSETYFPDSRKFKQVKRRDISSNSESSLSKRLLMPVQSSSLIELYRDELTRASDLGLGNN